MSDPLVPTKRESTQLQPVDFQSLVDVCRSELQRIDDDSRAVILASKQSFRQWVMRALEGVARQLGFAIGQIAGIMQEAYEGIKGGFVSGFREGMKRGRGK